MPETRTYAQTKAASANRIQLQKQITILNSIIRGKDHQIAFLESRDANAVAEIRRLQYRIDSLEQAYRLLANTKGIE
jgi:hypothetical protein